ncbi:MAG: pilus assembly protein TadG-related protein [Pseudomonadota bacterium]
MPERRVKNALKLLSHARGNVAVICAIAIIPLAVVAGFAVDYQLITTKKTKAQFTLDSAIIAGSRKMQESATPQEVALQVRQHFSLAMANEDGIMQCGDPEVTIQGTDISAFAVCSQQTSLSAIAGVNELSFRVESASTFGIGMIDVAFVFDISGSMIGPRIEALKDATEVAIDQLLPVNPPPGREDDIRIAMVSYNNSMNAGPFFQAVTGQTPQQTHSYYHWYYRRWYNIPYNTTCVFQREGSEKFSDARPGPGQYMTPASYWDRNDCRSAEPVTLTTNRQKLVDYVNDLDPSGGTAGHLGVAWGWYMISPEWWDTSSRPSDPFVPPSQPYQSGQTPLSVGPSPRLYDEPDTAKALILMTDGAFNSTITSNQGSSTWQAKQICDRIKQTNIVIYSVAFQAPDSGEEVLEYCASGPEFFFDPSNGQELTQSYQAIATSISDLRLTQ